MSAKMFERRHHFLGTEISQSLLNSQLFGRCLLARTRITGSLFQTIDMNGLRHAATRAPLNGQLRSAVKPSSREAIAFRRLLQQGQSSNLHSFSSCSSRSATLLYPTPLRSKFLPEEVRLGSFASSRSFHHASRSQKEKKADTQPKTETPKEQSATEDKQPAAEDTSKENPTEESTAGEEKPKDEKAESEEGESKKEEKEAPPPPPPHGDKSPWQVFTDTLQSEFKASKEWNESTKALAAGAQQFTENESVRRARQAYESTTGAVSSTAGNVLKTTAGAVGKGAAWTWETPVVKGVRTTVNATASVIEKGTRPIRQTEAYKNVKNVIDDGSSSRYGGWVEKEERRKARELRELQEAQSGGIKKPTKPVEEDPK